MTLGLAVCGASGRGMEGRWKARGGIISAGVVAGSVLMMWIWVWVSYKSHQRSIIIDK